MSFCFKKNAYITGEGDSFVYTARNQYTEIKLRGNNSQMYWVFYDTQNQCIEYMTMTY